MGGPQGPGDPGTGQCHCRDPWGTLTARELQQDPLAGAQLGPEGAGNWPRAWGQPTGSCQPWPVGPPGEPQGTGAGSDGSTGRQQGSESRCEAGPPPPNPTLVALSQLQG